MRVIRDQILAQYVEQVPKEKPLLFLGDEKPTTRFAKILQLGSAQFTVKVNDIVVLPARGGVEVTDGVEHFLILKEDEILGVIEQ